jgi:hypothetical protein
MEGIIMKGIDKVLMAAAVLLEGYQGLATNSDSRKAIGRAYDILCSEAKRQKFGEVLHESL